MNLNEYLLTCLNEECLEVAKSVDKALRFGLDDIGPGHKSCNLEEIAQELDDMQGVLELLKDNGVNIDKLRTREQVEAKKLKVKFFMEYSEKRYHLTREDIIESRRPDEET
jgi:NTP pyrophosphatase (non-canonical NTP hydrolase)